MTRCEKRFCHDLKVAISRFAKGRHPRKCFGKGGKYPRRVLDAFRALRGRIRRLEGTLDGR
jgi:hypothetical protein